MKLNEIIKIGNFNFYKYNELIEWYNNLKWEATYPKPPLEFIKYHGLKIIKRGEHKPTHKLVSYRFHAFDKKDIELAWGTLKHIKKRIDEYLNGYDWRYEK